MLQRDNGKPYLSLEDVDADAAEALERGDFKMLTVAAFSFSSIHIAQAGVDV